MELRLIHCLNKRETILHIPEGERVEFGRKQLTYVLKDVRVFNLENDRYVERNALEFISNPHCTFFLSGNADPIVCDGYEIKTSDKTVYCRSRNGTFLNEELVSGQGEILRGGEVLRFGTESLANICAFEIAIQKEKVQSQTQFKIPNNLMPKTLDYKQK